MFETKLSKFAVVFKSFARGLIKRIPCITDTRKIEKLPKLNQKQMETTRIDSAQNIRTKKARYVVFNRQKSAVSQTDVVR